MFARDLPAGDLEKKLTVAARLINANLGLRVVDLGFDGFDTHADQPQLAERTAGRPGQRRCARSSRRSTTGSGRG